MLDAYGLEPAYQDATGNADLIAIQRARMKLAIVLNSSWDVPGVYVRCFRALYHHSIAGYAVAQVVQRKGINGFELGRILGERAEQLKAYTISTLEAVVWLGIWDSTTPYEWEIVL